MTLTVYDVRGSRLAVLVDARETPGTHHVTFDGSGLASGTYFYRLETDGAVLTKRLVILR